MLVTQQEARCCVHTNKLASCLSGTVGEMQVKWEKMLAPQARLCCKHNETYHTHAHSSLQLSPANRRLFYWLQLRPATDTLKSYVRCSPLHIRLTYEKLKTKCNLVSLSLYVPSDARQARVHGDIGDSPDINALVRFLHWGCYWTRCQPVTFFMSRTKSRTRSRIER